MRPDMHDVLMAAKADAPPARLSVDQLVAAGKRRRRRRSAGWMIAAVTAVAVAVTVPQLVARPGSAPPATPAGDPTPSYAFSGFTAGHLRVEDPSRWKPAMQTAAVTNLRGDHTYGLLAVLAPGVEVADVYGPATMSGTDPVHGRPAYFVERGANRQFAWDYGGGIAVLAVADTVRPAEQRQLAEAFTKTASRPIRLLFKVDYLPVGYRLAEVGGNGSDIEVASAGHGSIKVQVAVPPMNARAGLSSTPTCRVEPNEWTECGILSADGRSSIHASGALAVGQTELFKILTSVQYDRSSSYPVSEALPISALPRR